MGLVCKSVSQSVGRQYADLLGRFARDSNLWAGGAAWLSGEALPSSIPPALCSKKRTGQKRALVWVNIANLNRNIIPAVVVKCAAEASGRYIY
jgi:hypothetical protein